MKEITQAMESFSQLARQRRSHRKFTSEPVSGEDLKSILETALRAPTGHGSRQWHFVTVTDPDKIAALSEVRDTRSQFLAEAPLVIAVLGQPESQRTWIEDGSVAAVTMQYQAQDLGLGSCWCQIRGRFKNIPTGSDSDIPLAVIASEPAQTVSSEQMVRQILQIPDSCSVLCLLAIGHPAEPREPLAESELPWDRVHSEKY